MAQEAMWHTSGIVSEVRRETNTLIIWLDGFEELQEVDIVPSMPEWMLQPQAAFLTKIMRAQRKQRKIERGFDGWGAFEVQPYMDMTEEELLNAIVDCFQTKEGEQDD